MGYLAQRLVPQGGYIKCDFCGCIKPEKGSQWFRLTHGFGKVDDKVACESCRKEVKFNTNYMEVDG